MNRKINIYNQKKRIILCVANKCECLTDGTIIHEEELQVGEKYTYIKGEVHSGDSLVYLKEIPRKYGYQACLFEELQPYDVQILERGYNQIEPDCQEGVRAKLERMKKLCEERDSLYEKHNGLKRKKAKGKELLER